MTIDGYDVYIEEAYLESYEQTAYDDEFADFGILIRVLLAADSNIFEEEDDMLINTTFHGTKSDLESELYELVCRERFAKEKQFSFDMDEYIPTATQFEPSFLDS